MATMYTKTALKKIKKDDLVQMFLDLQAKNYDDKMENEKLKSEDDQMENTLASLNFYKECNEDLKEEIKKLKEENDTRGDIVDGLVKTIEELKVISSQAFQEIHYYKCFVNAVDPKCNMMNSMEKQDVDEYSTDDKLRKKLYESFHIDEDDEED